MNNRTKIIDASLGDTVFAFNVAARGAMQQSLARIHQYDLGAHAKNVMWNIETYFHDELHLKRPNFTGVGLSCYNFTVGTTGGYSMAIQKIAEDAKALDGLMHRTTKPVIIMPVPTYGLFFDQLTPHGIEIARLEREPDGSVAPTRLAGLIRTLHNDKTKTIVAYYDSNPNNPTGYIRTREETEQLAAIFLQYNRHIAAQKEKYRETVTGGGFYDLKDLQCGIKIIDDMVYMGTEYGDKKPVPFMAIDGMYDHTIMLAGGSKIGLAGLRAGIVVANDDYSRHFNQVSRNNNYFLPPAAMYGLQYVFPKTDEQKSARAVHLQKMNETHRFSGLLMKALINGIADVQVTPEETARMEEIVGGRNAKQRLARGINDVRVSTTPEAGFFHLLDFSAIKGGFYDNALISYKHYSGTTEARDEWALEHLGNGAGIKFCSGVHTGLDKKQMMVRATFAMQPRAVVAAVNRIETMLGQLASTPKNTLKP